MYIILLILLSFLLPSNVASNDSTPAPPSVRPAWWNDTTPADRNEILLWRNWHYLGPFIETEGNLPSPDSDRAVAQGYGTGKQRIVWKSLTTQDDGLLKLHLDRDLRMHKPGICYLRIECSLQTTATANLVINGTGQVQIWLDDNDPIAVPFSVDKPTELPLTIEAGKHRLVLRLTIPEPKKTLHVGLRDPNLRAVLRRIDVDNQVKDIDHLIIARAYKHLGEFAWALWHRRVAAYNGTGISVTPKLADLVKDTANVLPKAERASFIINLLEEDRKWLDKRDEGMLQNLVLTNLRSKETIHQRKEFLRRELTNTPEDSRWSILADLLITALIDTSDTGSAAELLADRIARMPGPSANIVDNACHLSSAYIDADSGDQALAMALIAFACAHDERSIARATDQVVTAIKSADGNLLRARRWLIFLEHGPSGKDRVPDTDDDLENEIALVKKNLPDGWCETISAAIDDKDEPSHNGYRCLWIGDNTGALQAFGRAWRRCPIDKKQLSICANDIAVALKAHHGYLAAGRLFFDFQQWGVAGPDGVKETEDDLVDPLSP